MALLGWAQNKPCPGVFQSGPGIIKTATDTDESRGIVVLLKPLI
jgi:hypothetical protein